jgi:ubiquitin carboxyl-terminal hydrolase 4/11/15
LEKVYSSTNPTEPREPQIEDRWGTKSVAPITTPVSERAFLKVEVHFKDLPYEINVRKLHVPYEYVPLSQSSIEKINTSAMEAEESANVYDCLRLFEEKEQLEEDNMWYCSNCKDHKQAFKKMDIYKAPKILLIHLKRFKGTGLDFSGKSKILDKIGYPVEGLDLTEHVLNHRLPGSEEEDIRMEEEKSRETIEARSPEGNRILYDLYGVILHSGNMGFGHYIAYARDKVDGGWYCFNDSDVSRIDNHRVVSENAYCLLYRRRE